MNNAKIINIALLIVVLMAYIQLSVAQELSLTYDTNGNLVTGDGYYRIYNSLNQLWKIYNGSNQNGTLLEELIYHPTEERVYIKRMYNSDGNVTETVYYISQRFVRVVNQSGTYDFGYVYHNGQLVVQDNPDGTTIYIHGDHLGSVGVVTDEGGNVIENSSYSPYGLPLSGGQTIDRGYEGKEQDDLIGDIDFNARRYDADLAMFVQPDLIIQDAYDPQSFNRYMFERGNPVKYTDPDGRDYVELKEEDSLHKVIMIYNENGAKIYSWAPKKEKTRLKSVEVEVTIYYGENEEEAIRKYEEDPKNNKLNPIESTRTKTDPESDQAGRDYAESQQRMADAGTIKYFGPTNNCWQFNDAVIKEINYNEQRLKRYRFFQKAKASYERAKQHISKTWTTVKVKYFTKSGTPVFGNK